MQINEVFMSFQGEGRYTGYPALFIRTQGCNLNCHFCDTKYTWKEGQGQEYKLQELIDIIMDYKAKHVVITGGEPLCQSETSELISALLDAGVFVEIETNGTIFGNMTVQHQNLHINVSPKLDFLDKKYLETIVKWNGFCDYKFVVRSAKEGGAKDLATIQKMVNDYKLKNVFLMPEGITGYSVLKGTKWLLEEVKKRDLPFAVTTRMHVILYENVRGV